jgi:hypothetical protein
MDKVLPLLIHSITASYNGYSGARYVMRVSGESSITKELYFSRASAGLYHELASAPSAKLTPDSTYMRNITLIIEYIKKTIHSILLFP